MSRGSRARCSGGALLRRSDCRRAVGGCKGGAENVGGGTCAEAH